MELDPTQVAGLSVTLSWLRDRLIAMHLTLAALALIVGVAVLVLFGPALIAAVPARLVPWQPPPDRGYPTLPRRAQVLVPSLLVGFCFIMALGSLAGHFLLCVLPWAGPLLLSTLHGDMPSTAVALHAGLVLLAIAAHPLRPNALTGLITVAGCGWWVLIGMACTYSGA